MWSEPLPFSKKIFLQNKEVKMDSIASVSQWLQLVWQDWSTLIRIFLIIVSAVILRALLLGSVKRVVKGISSGKSLASSITPERMILRAKTLGSVLSNFITWSIYVIAVTMLLSELGVAVGALIAGAGILGAALGFGAQNIVRDLLSGLFIVFEDQYGIGDSVDLGEASGVVESVGLRITQLRDSKGTLWYVRNGEILRVGNMSHQKKSLATKSAKKAK
jgi:small conductance mechanosensitive channel